MRPGDGLVQRVSVPLEHRNCEVAGVIADEGAEPTVTVKDADVELHPVDALLITT